MCFRNIDQKKLEEMIEQTMDSLNMKRLRDEEDLLESISLQVNLKNHADTLIELTPVMLNPRDIAKAKKLLDHYNYDTYEQLARNLIFDRYMELEEVLD